jgi:glycosyltransferase involved in cell wall biosynthesis
MRITYLLQDTSLFGGVKVVLRQADLLARRGHQVTVASPAPPPSWYRPEAAFTRVPSFAAEHLPAAEVTVATFWSTILPAVRGARGEVAHYCQGFEASYRHNLHEHAEIHAAYAEPVPALAVSAHLAALLARRFGRPARVVPQPLEPFFAPAARQPSASPPRILIVGPFEIDWKGVATALAAVRALRASGVACQVVRISQWPQSDAERQLLVAEEFHCHLAPATVAEVMRGCDLMLAPSWEQEGFGLPALEAMASGVPVVASDVSCYRDFAADGARLAPPRDPEGFAGAAREILRSDRTWRQLRKAGLEVAARFAEPLVAVEAEGALEWIASGAWRREARRLAGTGRPSPPVPSAAR